MPIIDGKFVPRKKFTVSYKIRTSGTNEEWRQFFLKDMGESAEEARVVFTNMTLPTLWMQNFEVSDVSIYEEVEE